MVFPELMGVIFPLASIVATERLLLVHVPPVTDPIRLMEFDRQSELLPVITGTVGVAVTVTSKGRDVAVPHEPPIE